MKHIFAVILTSFVLLTYIVGLSNYVVTNLLHFIHHSLSHTLYQHNHHSQNEYGSHGHSHNSFVDYSLFVEDNKKGIESNNEALPNNTKVEFFSHVFSGECSILIDFHLLKINHSMSQNFLISQAQKPPYPPPRFLAS